VQDSLSEKSVAGSSVKVVGPPVCPAGCDPLVAHPIVYQLPVTLTASLNMIETVAFFATPVAPASGDVAVTAGAKSTGQTCSGLDVLRGDGASAAGGARPA